MRKYERLRCKCGELLGKRTLNGHILYASPLICPACGTDNTARIESEVVNGSGNAQTVASNSITSIKASSEQQQPKRERIPNTPLENPRHEAFCVAHGLLMLTATRAYMRCYPESSYEAAQRSASDLLRKPEIASRLEELRAEVARKTVTDGVLERSERVARLERRAVKMDEIIASRASDPEFADVPGGHTGLMCKTFKAAAGIVVEEYAVDTGLLKELRAVEQQAAQELGEWLTKTAVDVRDGLPLADVPENAKIEDIREAKEFLKQGLARLYKSRRTETVQ